MFAAGQLMKMVASGQVVVIQQRSKASIRNQGNKVDSIAGITL